MYEAWWYKWIGHIFIDRHVWVFVVYMEGKQPYETGMYESSWLTDRHIFIDGVILCNIGVYEEMVQRLEMRQSFHTWCFSYYWHLKAHISYTPCHCYNEATRPSLSHTRHSSLKTHITSTPCHQYNEGSPLTMVCDGINANGLLILMLRLGWGMLLV